MIVTTTTEGAAHTGPLSYAERIAMAALLEAAPAPLLSIRFTATLSDSESSDFYVGCCHLQARGWLRVRRPCFYELTPRCQRELPAVAGPDATTAIPAAVKAAREAAHAASRDRLLPLDEQRERMPRLFAFLGRHAINATGDSGRDEITAKVFTRLLALAQDHCLTRAEAADLRLALRRGDEALVRELAEEACASIPTEEFVTALGPSMSRLLTHRPETIQHLPLPIPAIRPTQPTSATVAQPAAGKGRWSALKLGPQ